MDDFIFSDLSVVNAKKTYKSKKTTSKPNSDFNKDTKPQPLTTKVAIKFLLEGRLKSKVCRYCLNISPGLSELDQIMTIGGTGNLYKVTIRDIVASFHPFKVVGDPNFPNKICQKCLDRALGAYLFTQQCERAERAMLNCFDDMYEKFEKLDPVDRPKKRGRQKLNPNYNILHAEHEKVIDYAEPIINIINIGAETVTKEPALNELECKKCWQVLPNLESLINHEKIHPKTMWYHCRLCGKSFPKPNQLKKHNHRVHVLGKELHPQVDKDFKCKECDHVTENFLQHLQHIEKHKFRNLMEHLIEKKMDTLCVVCFNKGLNLNALDKMVCIHGGHPDLMGDKTLYHVLASTLPNPKSYKYQELYVPTQAQIMSITKKANTDSSLKNSNPTIYDYKEYFVFSHPIVVTKNRFKTDHFYFYVFCDPENHMDKIIRDFNQIGKPTTKLVEVVEIDEIEDEVSPKKAKLCHKDTNISESNKTKFAGETISAEFATWGTKTAIVSKNINKGPNTLAIEKSTAKEKNTRHIDTAKNAELIDKQSIKKKPVMKNKYYSFANIGNNFCLPEYKFSKPEKVRKLDTRIVEDLESPSVSSKHNYLNLSESSKLGEEKTVMNDDKRLKQCDKCWIFKNTSQSCKCNDNVAALETATECKFCWIYKNNKRCEYCKRPIKMPGKPKVETNEKINKNTEIVKVTKDDKIWQCNICLTNNNSNRISCHCCGTTKPTNGADIKIPFGNNKTFFSLLKSKDKDNDKPTETEVKEKDIIPDKAKDETNKIAFIDEATMMDYKTHAQENPEYTNVMQNMEVETNSGFNITNIEHMEVEENPVTVSNKRAWNATPVFNFKIGNFPNFEMPNRSIVKTNLKFNIGAAVQRKVPQRKFKKVLRNIPKAFHH